MSKLGNLEIAIVATKFGLGVQNEARQRLTEFCQENTLVVANTFFLFFFLQTPSFNNTREDSTRGHHQMEEHSTP